MKVLAPATSANIGAGFDTAAVALDLWNELEVTDGEGVVVEGEGASELAADETNLAVRAYALLADPSGKRFAFVNRIPLERGLGSSAAAIALGLAAAAPEAAAPRSSSRSGSKLEPHADNLAAALLGGPHALLGRPHRADRGDAAACARGGDPARAHLDRELAPRRSRRRSRTPRLPRAPGGRRFSARAPRAAMRGSLRLR